MANKRSLPLAEGSPSRAWIPAEADRDALAGAAERCQACELYKRATHAVFGEGPTPARLMLVGEQPGDHEDLAGRPFVGPAGRLLDDALEEAEIARDEVYITNAVKHFKWEPRGKRRLHAKPNAVEIHACRGWLETEVELVRPDVIVCLGATAAGVFLGRTFRLTKARGTLIDSERWGARVLATYHPSAILRMRADAGEYERVKRLFTRDLAEAAAAAALASPTARVRRARAAAAP
jgi:DNA polymerase